MKIIIITLVFTLLLLVIIPLVLTLGIKYLPGGIQPSLGNTKRIYGDVRLSQSFISIKDNFAGIGTSIKNPNFANKEDLRIDIYDEKDQLIRTTSINGRNTADGNFMRITFPPIENSKGGKFTFSLSSTASTYENALEVFLTKDKTSWNMELKENGQKENESISFITLHKVASPFEVLGIIISGWITRLISDTFFFIFYTTIIIVLLVSLFIPWKSKRNLI